MEIYSSGLKNSVLIEEKKQKNSNGIGIKTAHRKSILIFFLFFLISPVVLAQSSNCVDGKVKIGSTSYNTIQLAVNAASSGDVISLGSGVFSENVSVNRKNNLTVSSECFARVQRIRVRNSDHFTLRDVFIKTPEGVSGSALSLNNVQIARIEDIHVYNSANRGIKVAGNNTDALFSKVFVYNNNEGGFLLEDGVDVTIKDSRVYGNQESGIFIRGVSSLNYRKHGSLQ